MKKVLFFTLLILACTLFSAPKSDWIGIAKSKGGNYEISSFSANSFSAKLTKNSDKKAASFIACRTVNKVENVSGLALSFKARITGDKPVRISPTLTYRKDGKVAIADSKRKLLIKSQKFTEFSLPLKKDFGITADKLHIWQLKLGLALLNASANENSGIEIKDLEISKAKVTTFFLIAPGKGGEYKFKEKSANEFALEIKSIDEKTLAGAQVCSNIDRPIHSQHKLQFSCRVANGKAPVRVKPIISYMNGKKSVMCWGPSIVLKGDTWKDHLISLDSSFKLADAVYQFRQLKFGIDIKGAKAETQVLVEFKNVGIVSADAAGLNTGLNEIIVYPQVRKSITPAKDALKVFVHFDNEDLSTVFDGRGRMRNLKDNQAYAGFRHILFETVQKEIKRVSQPEDADVIIYSSSRPDSAIACRIAEAVRKGSHLIAASSVADKCIADILPVKITKLPEEDFPERRQLKPVKGMEKLFDGLNTAKFGVYTRLTPNAGAKVICRYSDDTPAMAEGKAEKGRVLYLATAFGSDLLTNYTARDAFLLRAISYISGKKLPLTAKKDPAPDHEGYYTGAGSENFGRFGIILGDGLIAEEVNNYLSVINESQEYRFTNSSTPKIKIDSWNFKLENSKAAPRKVLWTFRFAELKKAVFTAKCVIPENWKGADIQFAVQEGIDDLAEVLFNGIPLGKVTKDMSEYWKRPHRYTISAAAINFGKENTITVINENIRGFGGFGSCPELVCLNKESSLPWKFVPDRVNWLGKGGVITEENKSKRRFDTSLAFPGVRWEIFSDKIELELTNIAEYCAFPTDSGINVREINKLKDIPVNWSKPWLLLFKENADHPLLLVFAKRQDKIDISKVGNAVSGLTFHRKGGIGMITPVWLYGRGSVDTASWKKALPEETVKRADFWMTRAFKYPVKAEEFFKIANNRVNIKTKYSYITAENDWHIKCSDYAPVSPLAYFSRGKLFKSDQVEDWNLVTSYGNYAARDNADTVYWSLPLPSMEYRTIPGIRDFEGMKAAGNKVFRNGLRWSCGGRVPAEKWTAAYPCNTDFPNCFNIGMHGWLMGINQAFISPYNLDDESVAGLRKRTRKRFFEAIEFFQYKAVARWREEPMSGIRYGVFFPNRHVHSTKYAPGTGTTINYADCNETAYMIVSLARMLADRHGQRDFVSANQSYLRDAIRLLMVSDDWGYMACHCRESGLSATIDMLNCEYAAMMSMARLAEIIGDRELKEQALYRAARRMVPTYSRLIFKDYAVKNRLASYVNNIAYGVGFAETGYVFRTKGTKPVELDLFDTSQGIPEELADFYEKYASKEIRVYFNDFVVPSLYGKDGRFQLKMYMLGVAAKMPSLNKAEAQKLARAAVRELDTTFKKLNNDWPGMCFMPYLSQVLYRTENTVKLHKSENVDIEKFIYDPAKKELEIVFTADKNAKITLERPLTAKQNNKIEIPIKQEGRQTVKIRCE